MGDPLKATFTGGMQRWKQAWCDREWWCSSLTGEKTGKGHDIFLCKEKTAKLLQSYHIYCGVKKQFLKKDLAFSENLVGYSEEGEYRNSCTSSCSDLYRTSQGRLSVQTKGAQEKKSNFQGVLQREKDQSAFLFRATIEGLKLHVDTNLIGDLFQSKRFRV